MLWRTPMTKSKRSLLATTRSVKSLPCSIPWRTLHSRYLRRLRVMDVSGSSPHTTSISPMSWIFEKSSVWKDEQSFYPLRSMDRTWLMSLKIANYKGVFIVGLFLGSEDCQPEQQSTHHNDHWWDHDLLLSISGGTLHTNDNSLRPIDVCFPRYGRYDHAIEWLIRTPINHWELD